MVEMDPFLATIDFTIFGFGLTVMSLVKSTHLFYSDSFINLVWLNMSHHSDYRGSHNQIFGERRVNARTSVSSKGPNGWVNHVALTEKEKAAIITVPLEHAHNSPTIMHSDVASRRPSLRSLNFSRRWSF